MVVIRLARGGSKKRPFYNVVAADSRNRRDGRFIERLGFYNPVGKDGVENLRQAQDRVNYWIGVNGVTRVVVNAIDQWGPSLPRIDASGVFVPTLIDTLRTHETTSMILGVEDPRSEMLSKGLSANADTVISLTNDWVVWPRVRPSDSAEQVGLSFTADMLAMAGMTFRPSAGIDMDGFSEGAPLLTIADGSAAEHAAHAARQQQLVLSVERTSRGGTGNGRAIMYMFRDQDMHPHVELIPIAPEFLHHTRRSDVTSANGCPQPVRAQPARPASRKKGST